MFARPLYDGIKKVYGEVNNPKSMMVIATPFPLKIAWDKSIKTNKITCHKLIGNDLKRALCEILAHYGYEKICELGIDIFGGCLNARPMRGSNKWSTHAWGIAIDLDPERNTLHETAKTARFARPEYEAMINIFEKHGFHSQGRNLGYDWQHFQAVRYK